MLTHLRREPDGEYEQEEVPKVRRLRLVLTEQLDQEKLRRSASRRPETRGQAEQPLTHCVMTSLRRDVPGRVT